MRDTQTIFRLLGCTSKAQHFQYKRAEKGAVYWLNLAKFYPGFVRKGDRVHIITFRVTTRLRSKSNRCI
jgi:hypothetical protein